MTARSTERVGALQLGQVQYFTGRPCKRGHIAPRYCSSNHCIECLRQHEARYTAEDPDRRLAQARAWRARNKAKVSELAKRYRAQNLERCKESCLKSARKYYQANKDKSKNYVRQWCRANPERRKAVVARWLANNPEWQRTRLAKRRAQLKNAIPKWADQKRIGQIYAEAARLTRETGIDHHIDHAVPLISKLVCGLHVAANLQILPASENHKKSNRFLP